jgi:hypothetical protein
VARATYFSSGFSVAIINYSATNVRPWVARQTVGTLTSSESDSTNTPIFLMVLWRLCAVTTPIPWGTSQLENYIRVVVSLTAFAESILSQRHMTVPLEHHYQGCSTVETHKRPSSDQKSHNNSGRHQQLCGRRSELIHATLPPGSVPPIKEINDPG